VGLGGWEMWLSISIQVLHLKPEINTRFARLTGAISSLWLTPGFFHSETSVSKGFSVFTS